MIKPSLSLLIAASLCLPLSAGEKKNPKVPTTLDPALAEFGIYAKSAPQPTKTTAIATTLPLQLRPHDRIAFVGNTLLEREQDYGYIEAALHGGHPTHSLRFRNFSWAADEIDLQPRPDNFASVAQHLTFEQSDVIFAAFGFNESFAGVEAIPQFKQRLATYLETLRTHSYNGKSAPRIVLLSPPANENITNIPAADLNNARLAEYVKAMAEVAADKQVGFVDLFAPTLPAMADDNTTLTTNGVHLNDAGYALVAKVLYQHVCGADAPSANNVLRTAVVDKNKQYFRRYRPLNTFYYTGGRNKNYGYLDFLPAMRNFDVMTKNRDERIWAIAQGKNDGSQPVDDSNVPALEQVTEARGANEWLKPEDELKAFKIDPRFEVNLFASEQQFPDLAKPIQMRWDSRGRLWVCCSTTYPHVYPGREPGDKIIILEDTDKDGRADKSTLWADNLHIPLSFELYGDGALVSEQPNLTWVRDTDGDGKADTRQVMLSGFGSEDSHHSLHDFVWTPDGDLLFRESIFHNTQVETAYGPVRAKNSAWFSFRPETQKLITFGNYPNTNPWGVTFDDWGRHMASHPIFANAFHALNPPYPQQHPAAKGIPAYSGVCGQEFINFPMWPKDMQGGFVKVRYKPTNRVEFHEWEDAGDSYKEKYVGDIIFSENLSFIPVDVKYGPMGAMYVCDWYNPVKGHAQYSLRDPRRDRTSGRIWRIVPKGATLQQPPKIADAPVADLVKILERNEYSYRYWARRELRGRPVDEVAKALDAWLAQLDRSADRFRHHQVEALWTYRTIGVVRPALLAELIACDTAPARAAATQQLRYWYSAFDDNGSAFLHDRAADSNPLVRMEAITAASYIGTKAALNAVVHIIHGEMGTHLRYAAVCALGSHTLRPLWENDPMLKAMVNPLFNGKVVNEEKDAIAIALQKRTANDANFDNQKNIAKIIISSIPERMLYTPTKFTVKAGQPVQLVFNNPDLMQHNLVIVKPGALEKVGMAGNDMAKDPNGIKQYFIPQIDEVLFHTTLVDPHSAEVLRFNAPKKPGVYPFVCTFPGHWIIMNGTMTVE